MKRGVCQTGGISLEMGVAMQNRIFYSNFSNGLSGMF